MVHGSNCLSRAREGKGRDCGEGLAIHLLHTWQTVMYDGSNATAAQTGYLLKSSR